MTVPRARSFASHSSAGLARRLAACRSRNAHHAITNHSKGDGGRIARNEGPRAPILDVFGPRLDASSPVHCMRTASARSPQRCTERGPRAIAREEEEESTLRSTYRNEMRHLLELEGSGPLSEQSDYDGSPPAYGQEQFWLARKGTQR
jgi:hypothetical protein